MKNLINKPILADCFDIFPQIESGSIDMIFCDLPYGTTACKWDSILPFEKLWAAYERIIKPNGAIVLTASQPFTAALIMSNPKMFKHEWIWQKTIASNFFHVKRQPQKKHESVLVFGKKDLNYIPQMEEGKAYKDSERKRTIAVYGENEAINNKKAIENTGTRYPSSIQIFSNPNNGVIHNTQKPVALVEYMIKTYSQEGDLILDNCAGSFTTAIACENLKRRWICIEKNPEIFEKGNQRVLDHASKI